MSKKEIYSNPKEIAKYIIDKTPIGYLESSIKNLTILLKQETMNNPEILKEIKNYKENHLTPITIPKVDKKKAIISSINKDSDGFYYDQGQKIRFKLNDKCEVVKLEEYESKNETRKKIEKKLIEYVNKYYILESTFYNVYFDSLLDKIHILISGQNISKKNFWSGEWLSIWEIDLNDKKVTGEIKVNTVYNEDGNIQFNFKKNYETINKGKDDDSIVDELITYIAKIENEIQKNIEKDNENNNEEYFMPLRKRLSFIGKNMNWSLDQIQFSQNQKQ